MQRASSLIEVWWVSFNEWKKSSTESDDSKLGWSFVISTREIIEFHVALNLDWFLQNGDLPFFIHPNFLMSTMATWLPRSPLVPRYLCLMSVPIGSYSLQVGGLFELDPTERDHGTTVLLYEKETRICHNWDLGDYFLRPLWGKKIHKPIFALWKGFGWFQEPFTVNRNSGQVSLKSVWRPLKPSIIFFYERSESNYLCLAWTHFLCVFWKMDPIQRVGTKSNVCCRWL